MASNQWCDLWGPISILDYEDDLRFKGITNERLGDLLGTVGITSLELESSKEIIDLSLLCHLQDLKSISLKKCKFENLNALTLLPALESLAIDNCNFNTQGLGELKSIKRLFLCLKDQQNLPGELVFPIMEWLYLSGKNIVSIEFIRNSKFIYDLNIKHTSVSDISPVIECSMLKYISFSDKYITDIRPLASLKHLERVSVWPEDIIHRAIEEWGFVRPIEKKENTANELKNAIKQKIEQKDWKYILQLPWSNNFKEALCACYHGEDFEFMRVLLNHPDDEIFKEVFIISVKCCRSLTALNVLRELAKEQRHRLYEPLLACIERYPNNEMCCMEMDYLELVAGPEYAEIYHRILARRSRFTSWALCYIRAALKTVSKTQDHSLVEPITDLLNFECRIIGGNNLFMKQIFKAIGQLGNAADIPLVVKNYSVENEKREDVKKEYNAMMTKLSKKKA